MSEKLRIDLTDLETGQGVKPRGPRSTSVEQIEPFRPATDEMGGVPSAFAPRRQFRWPLFVLVACVCVLLLSAGGYVLWLNNQEKLVSQIRTEIRTADAEISAGNPDAAITSLERALLICGGEPLSESRQSRYLPLVERTLSELRQVTDEAEGGRVIMALADGEFAEFQASGVVPARFQRQEDRFTRVLAANMQSQTAAESQRREALKEEEKRKRAEAERLAAEERKRQEEAERAQAEETEDIEFVEVGDLLRYPSLYSDHRFMAGLVEKPRFVLTWAEVSSLSYLTETEDTQSLYVAHLRDPISGETVTSTRSQVVLIDPPLRGPKTVYLGGVLMPVPDRTAEFFFLALVVPIDDSETSPSPGETKPNVTVPRNIDFGSIFKDVRSKP